MLQRDRQIRTQVLQLADACLFAASFWLAYAVRGNLAFVDEWLEREARLHYVRPRAGTIALVHYDLDMPSEQFCQRLFDLNGAFVMPGKAFGVEHAFRLGYACSRDVLEGGLAAVSAYLAEVG